MPLPDSFVNALFARLHVRYGSEWTRKWEGLDMTAVKADWAEELAGLETRPEAIKHALAHLPERAPHAMQFYELCLRAPMDEKPQLRHVRTAEEIAKSNAARAEALAKLKLRRVV